MTVSVMSFRVGCLAGMALAHAALGQASRTLVYGDTSTNIPRSRTWSGSAWSAAAATLDIGGSPRWVVLKSCPKRSELIAVLGDNQNDMNMMVYNGSSWGNQIEASGSLVTDSDRPFFAAYEQNSGDALVVYRVGSVSTVYYRTWNGTSWSAQSSIAIPGSGNPKWIYMVPKPGSDEIMVVIVDSKKDISALVWNGSSFANTLLLDNSTSYAGEQEFDAVYETLTGRCVVAWSPNGGGGPGYRIWTGSAWLSTGSLPDPGGKTHWLRMASDPASNKIIAMTLDSASDVNVTVWNGSSWSAVTEFETDVPDTDRRAMDVAFEPSGTKAVAMYGRTSQNTPFYRTYNGSTWSSAITGPNMSNPPSVIQFTPSSGSEILIGVERKNDGAFCFMRWNGSSIVDYQVLASDLGGPNGNECFMISNTTSSGSTPARILTWTEETPN